MFFLVSYENVVENRKIKREKSKEGRWWHKGLHSTTSQFSVWSVVDINLYKVNRDGPISDKIMQTIFKISYLFWGQIGIYNKKEVKFRYQEGYAKRQEQMRPQMNLKPWCKHFLNSKNAFSTIRIPVIYWDVDSPWDAKCPPEQVDIKIQTVI